MNIRRATLFDLPGVAAVYDEIHDAEEAGSITTGWIRGVYPVRATAEAALQRGDLFVMEEKNRILGAALINQTEVDVYADAPWKLCSSHTGYLSKETGPRTWSCLCGIL